MDEIKYNTSKEELFLVPLPEKTDTYTPLSHKNLIEIIDEQLYKNGLSIVSAQYRQAEKGNKMTTYYNLNRGNSDMNLMLGFSNSYDKSLPVKFAIGSYTFICSNGALIGEFTFKRKHTGEVYKDLTNFVEGAIFQVDDMFTHMENDFNRLKETEITKRLAAELLGRMMIEENIITPTQLNIVKNELDKPTYVEFKNMTGYNLYQHCTHALKTAHPTFAIKQLVRTHDFLTSNLLVQ